ncbi:hypothetical protein JMUB7542_27900 [Staphylococcus aureus]
MSSVYSRWRERRKVKKAIDSGTLSQSDFDIELLSQVPVSYTHLTLPTKA